MPKRSRIGELNAAGFVVAPTKVKGGISIDRILEEVPLPTVKSNLLSSIAGYKSSCDMRLSL